MSKYIKKNVQPPGTITPHKISEELGINKVTVKTILDYLGVVPVKTWQQSEGVIHSYYPMGSLEAVKDFVAQHPNTRAFFNHVWIETHPEEHQCGVEKFKKSMMERYGVENPGQMPGHKEKMESTFLETHGETLATHRSKSWYETRDRREQANIARYGCACSFASKEIQEKSHSQEAKEKAKATFKNTCMEKYGVDNVAKVPEITEHMRKTIAQTRAKRVQYVKEVLQGIPEQEIIEQYGVYDMGVRVILERFGKSIYNYKGVSYIPARDLPEINEALQHLATTEPSYSIVEEELKEYVTSIYNGEIRWHDRTVLRPKEIDIYLPEINIGIEFNGNYWHSSLRKDVGYHQQKSFAAQANGVRLVHIYEYEWQKPQTQPIIKAYLKMLLVGTDRRIYARDCSVRVLKNNDVFEFLETNHLQGHRNARVTLGLFYNDEMVQVMSFSHSHKYEWEIIRECTLLGTQVVGGCSKLFKYFIKTFDPSQVMSYCDFNKFTGDGYLRIGMQFDGYTKPDMKWLLPHGIVVNRSPQLNEELRTSGAVKIFGAGSKRFIWRKLT